MPIQLSPTILSRYYVQKRINNNTIRNPLVISLNTNWVFKFIVCEDGFYGSSCNNTCGHCLNGDFCDKRNGMCLKGCQSNFLNPFCIDSFI